MTDYLTANLELLYKRQPALKAAGLESSEDPSVLEVLQTPSGLPTARLQGTYLHSRYDPMKEARRIVASGTVSAPAAAIVLGFGLGYLAEAYCEQHPDKPAIIVEEKPARFRQALESRDLRALLASSRISWCIGEDVQTVFRRIETLPHRNLAILRLPGPRGARGSGYYRQIETLLASVLDRQRVNINTLRRFGELWVRNLLSNLDLFIASPGVRAGEKRFTRIPAVVLAAGPSLEEVLPDLKGLRERCLIVAVDTSYRFCRYQGVEPDFLITVDPQYWNSRHLDWLPRAGTVLVSESSAHPRIFRLGGREKEELYFVSSFFPLGAYIEQLIGKRGLIGAGGSVATTAWDFCRYLGCSPICMAGLDLGFPGKRTHAKGAFFEESMHGCSSRFFPAEQMNFEYLHQAQPTALANNLGGRTLTDRRMLIYKSWFENQIKQQQPRDDLKTYSLAGGGIAIEGMEYLRREELMRLPPIRGRIEKALRELRKRGKQMVDQAIEEKRKDRVIQNLTGLMDELERLRELAARGAQLAGSDAPAGGLVPLLAEVDERIMDLASRQIAGFLFQPLIHEILENPEGGDFSQILATSRHLYRSLESSASYHRKLLGKCLERLQCAEGSYKSR
jgi:hypothetical protein